MSSTIASSLAPEPEVQERAARGLRGDELAGAPLDLRRVAQPDAHTVSRSGAVDQAVGGEGVDQTHPGGEPVRRQRASDRDIGAHRATVHLEPDFKSRPSSMTDEATLTIGQVAERAGLNTSRIRFYERTGVLPLPDRVSGQRRYHPDVLQRLSIIDVAQRAGMTLDEIAPLTGPDNRTADASAHIRSLADDKLPHIEALITRAQAVKAWLEVAQHCDCRERRRLRSVRRPHAAPAGLQRME